MTGQLITTQQLAERLGVAVVTLETWRAKRIGPPWIPISTGTKRPAIRYSVADVDSWLASRRQATDRRAS